MKTILKKPLVYLLAVMMALPTSIATGVLNAPHAMAGEKEEISITDFTLNGKHQDVRYNPSNPAGVTIRVEADQSVKFTRLSIVKDADSDEVKYFQNTGFSTDIVRVWKGEQSGLEEIAPDGSYSVFVKIKSEGESNSYDDTAGPYKIIVDRTFVEDITPPEVTGVEDGKHYNTDVTPTFGEGTATLNGDPFVSGSIVSEEGEYLLRVIDDSGNETTIRFFIDKTAPQISGIKNGDIYNVSVFPTFDEGSGLLNERPFNSGDEVADEGEYALVVTDLAGNMTTVQFSIDKTAPANGSIEIQDIDNGPKFGYTNSEAVYLTLFAEDDFKPVMMRIANTKTELDTAKWDEFNTDVDWSLITGDGEKEVFVQYKDGGNNITKAISSKIILDTVAPKIEIDPTSTDSQIIINLNEELCYFDPITMSWVKVEDGDDLKGEFKVSEDVEVKSAIYKFNEVTDEFPTILVELSGAKIGSTITLAGEEDPNIAYDLAGNKYESEIATFNGEGWVLDYQTFSAPEITVTNYVENNKNYLKIDWQGAGNGVEEYVLYINGNKEVIPAVISEDEAEHLYSLTKEVLSGKYQVYMIAKRGVETNKGQTFNITVDPIVIPQTVTPVINVTPPAVDENIGAINPIQPPRVYAQNPAPAEQKIETPADSNGIIKGEEENKDDENETNWTPWIILIILIILAGAATGGYFYWFNGEEEVVAATKDKKDVEKPIPAVTVRTKKPNKKSKRW